MVTQPEAGGGNTGGLSGKRLWLMIAGLAVVAVVVMFYRLGTYRTLSTHETYAVVPAREMLQTGDWVVPRSGGLPRLRKPPLGYWVVAISASIFGELDEWTARLPAAVAALLLAALVGHWACKWYGREAGLGAALVQLTSAWVILYARKAEVDMPLCLLMTAAMFLLASWPLDESRTRSALRWTAIYGLLAASWMAKFHFGPMMVMVPGVLYLLIQRRRPGLWHLVNPLGLLMLAAAALVWPHFVLQQVPDAWQVWKQETMGRAIGSLGTRPWWYYFPYLLSLPLPWTGFVLFALPASWRKACKERDPRERFLWVWIISSVAILTLSADKHKHYLMAMLPAFSLLAGQSFVWWSRYVRRTPFAGTSVAGIGSNPYRAYRNAVFWTVMGLTGPAAVWWIARGRADAQYLLGPVMLVAAVGWAGMVMVVWLAAAGRRSAAGYTAVAAFLTVYVCVMGELVPAQDHRQQAARFAAEVRSHLAHRRRPGSPAGPGRQARTTAYNPRLRPDQFAPRNELSSNRRLLAYRLREQDPVVFYLGSPVLRVMTAEALWEKVDRERRVFVVAYEPDLQELASVGQYRVVQRMQVDPTVVPPKQPPLVVIELTMPAVAAGGRERPKIR